MMPYAGSMIAALKGTRWLVDNCGHVPESSEALGKFRIAVDELIRELQPVAKFEPRVDFGEMADEKFYRKG